MAPSFWKTVREAFVLLREINELDSAGLTQNEFYEEMTLLMPRVAALAAYIEAEECIREEPDAR